MDHRVTLSVLLAVICAVAPAGSQPLHGRVRPRPKCTDAQPLEQRTELANVIVSGYVGKVMRKPRTLQYNCEVQIVRIFKGEETVHNGISPPMDPQTNQIMVTGFGDPAICDNAAHVGDVKLLLLDRDRNGFLRLNSSLVRITLGNLDMTNAFVKGKFLFC
ncbi:agrin-like [Patiria miniata]|uniref:NtA domain-containing protein n=1 Tax=Patiria miniata TaxID=46514 RepID=A0A914AE44_PATMI|nr:agrin-like [Patiria miniata]